MDSTKIKLKEMLCLSLLLFVGYLSSNVVAQCLTGQNNSSKMNPETHTKLMSAKLDFALESMNQATLIEPNDNIFFSPHSLFEALMLAYFGARGTTEQSLKQALKMPEDLSKVDVQRSYSFDKWIKQQRESTGDVSPSYELKTANRLWISSTKKVKDCMLNLFSDELQMTDFQTDPEGARDRINDWVSNITKGHITDLIPSDGIDESTDLVLTNAVYFKGLWQNRFDPKNSKRDIFYGSTNSIVTFMRQKRIFNHLVSEDLGAHVLELPYKGENISMFIFLPPFVNTKSIETQVSTSDGSINRDGIRQLIQRMTKAGPGLQELKEILDLGMPPREVDVSLPKFTIEKELPVNQLLQALGAGEILGSTANLRGFLENSEDNLHLGDAVHRARIELTEEGTIAAAATAIFSFRSSRPAQPAVFNANHPFVYLIYDRDSKAIIFSGIYRTPVTLTETTE